MAAELVPKWPPPLSQEQIDALTQAATDYALSHSIIYRPLASSASTTPPLDASIHAPLSLLPTPFPKALYDASQRLQPLYDDLYARIALNKRFLTDVIGGNVILVDQFQERLWKIWRKVDEEGVVQALHLGLLRSDYLLHADEADTSLGIRQVELNTISSSFGPLCSKVSDMHRYLAQSTSYYHVSPHLLRDNMPRNDALHTLAAGLAAAHKVYEQRTAGTGASEDGSAPVVLFVVQDHERNAFDQRLIEYTLAEQHGIVVRRASLTELASRAKLEGPGRHLFVTNSASSVPEQVSVVYFRAGYGPGDYPTEAQWDARLLLERSLAIKCPTVALQLAGAKKVQQVLANPGVVESLVQGPGGRVWTQDDVGLIRQSFMPMYGMEHDSHGLTIASDPEQAKEYVLKPQREGGGNNVYREDIVPTLARLDALDQQHGLQSTASEKAIKRREGYILMKLIQTPGHVGTYLLRHGADQRAMLAPHVISELGAFGSILFEGTDATDATSELNIVFEQTGGHLLRTKAAESNEGGVAAGFSVIDSPVLV